LAEVLITDIGYSINEQTISVSQINETITHIDDSTQSNADTVENINKVSSEVKEMASHISLSVQKNKF
jgi:methyl-accepting chemotaxis protein